MFWTLTWLAFGFAALLLFVFAFNHLAKGRIGAALIFGFLALVMCSAAGAVAVYVD